MLEVNAIYFILLAEGFVLMLILLLAWLLVTLVRMRRRNRSIADFAAQIRQGSSSRSEQTRAFLQAVYKLDDENLNLATMAIDKQEGEFFELLIVFLKRLGKVQAAALETSLAGLMQSYKSLQPNVDDDPERVEIEAAELTSLRGENDELRSELSVANNRLSDMIVEFGEIFGGGKNHQLTLQEIMEKVDAMKSDQIARAPRQAQK